MAAHTQLSIIIPVYNEAVNIPPLFETIKNRMSTLQEVPSWELIFVDDGSNDGSPDVVEKICTENSNVSLVSFRKNFGKAAALTAGFRHALGDIIITMDGDSQDSPDEIPKFLNLIHQGYDLVSGWKQNRKDSLEKKMASKVFNFFVRKFTGISLHDFDSGYKAYRSWCVKRINLTGNLYRFLPVLIEQQGGKVTEIPVTHYPRVHGSSKYGIKRYFEGASDFLTVLFLSKFLQKPAYFFSIAALPLLLLGSAIMGYLLVGHLYYLISKEIQYQLVNRPLLQIAIIFLGLGFQIFLTGFLAEMIVKLSGSDPAYRIRKIFRSDNTPQS